MQQLVIIRGIPGSGKSTMARVKYPNHVHIEADMYFEDRDGNYRFDRTKLPNAHQWCQRMVKANLNKKYNVVVANTFIKYWEMKPYLEMANKLQIPVKIETAKGNYESVHNVPKEVIERMKNSFENSPQT